MNDCVLCEINTGNTGSNCDALHVAQYGAFYQFGYDSNGVRNYINPATFNQAALVALINHADPLKRIYPVMDLKTITKARAEGDVEEFDDKTKNRFDNGVKTMTALINNGGPILLGNVQKLHCKGNDLREYGVQINGNLDGVIEGTDGYLYPKPIYTQSSWIRYVDPTQATSQKIAMDYDYAPTLDDSKLRILSVAGTDLKTLQAVGLQNLVATISGISTAGATLKLTTEYGALGKQVAVTGLVSADLISFDDAATGQIYNATDDANVAVTVTATATPGVYTLAWVAQTISDVLPLSIKKTGYDGALINGTVITIV